jgi:hypothetical protein
VVRVIAGRRVLQVILGLIAVTFLWVGVWALLFPRSFYADFPGGGRHWVSPDGPYNQHLVRDVGGLNLGLALVTIVAAVTLAPVVVRAAALATLVYEAPHLAYHATHLSPYPGFDKVASISSLVLAVVLPIAALALASRYASNRSG